MHFATIKQKEYNKIEIEIKMVQKDFNREFSKQVKRFSKPVNINNENSNVLHFTKIRYFQEQNAIVVDYIPPKNHGSMNKEIKTKINYLGVVKTDPNAYAKQHADSIIESDKLPDYIKKIPTPAGIELVRLNSLFIFY